VKFGKCSINSGSASPGSKTSQLPEPPHSAQATIPANTCPTRFSVSGCAPSSSPRGPNHHPGTTGGRNGGNAGDVQPCRMREDEVLNLLRADLFPAAVDQALLATLDDVVSERMPAHQVAGSVKAVRRQGSGVVFGDAKIPSKRVGTAHQQLPDLTAGTRLGSPRPAPGQSTGRVTDGLLSMGDGCPLTMAREHLVVEGAQRPILPLAGRARARHARQHAHICSRPDWFIR
jgi:hypothetical protein